MAKKKVGEKMKFLTNQEKANLIKENLSNNNIKGMEEAIDFIVSTLLELPVMNRNMVTYGNLHLLHERLENKVKGKNKAKQIETIIEALKELWSPYVVKEYKGFFLGDLVYYNQLSNPVKITEFVNEQVVLIDGDKFVPLALISHEPRKQEIVLHRKNKWSDYIQRLETGSSLSYIYKQIVNNEINFNPFYQRDLVWTNEQQVTYLEALFTEKAVIRPTFILLSPAEEEESGFYYEVLDGKQRLSAIVSFIENEFPIFGKYYFKDLSIEDYNFLMNLPVTIEQIRKFGEASLSKEDRIHLFFEINEFGSIMDKEHLASLKANYLTKR